MNMATYQTSINHKQMDGEYRGDLMVQIPVCVVMLNASIKLKVKHNQKYVPNIF